MTTRVSEQRENPFSTRFVRPGALAFLFDDGETIDGLRKRFRQAKRRAAIVGPHGSGKSTLAATLAEAWRGEGANVRICELHDGQRRPLAGFAEGLAAGDVLIVDGYEQLGYWGRREVDRAVARIGCGLLATVHRPLRGWTTLYVVRPTAAAACEVVRRLTSTTLSTATAPDVDRETVARLFDDERGNIRELLFRLYDLYESQRK